MSDADEMRQAMLSLGEMFEPMKEWAAGFRESLKRDGWDDTHAQQMAAEAMILLMRKALTS